MPEPLKNSFGCDIPVWIADQIKTVHPVFDVESFLSEVLDGYDDLELTPRGWHIAYGLHRHLPASYPEALEILLASLGPEISDNQLTGMESFRYMPHIFFVAQYGLDHFERSMQAQYLLTKHALLPNLASVPLSKNTLSKPWAVCETGPLTTACMCGAWCLRGLALVCLGRLG